MEDLLFIILILAVIWYWWDTQQCNEIALAVCKQKCINAGLQLLDATVTRQRVWLRRGSASSVQICRLYSFEYYNGESSETGTSVFARSEFGERQQGYIVFLDTSVNQQLQRLRRDNKRPLLQTENPRQQLESLFEARHPIYLDLADLSIKTDRKLARKLASDIISRLPQHLL